MKVLPILLPSEGSSLSLSMGEDNMTGENGHGGPVLDHGVDVHDLEPSSLFPDFGLLITGPAPSSSSIIAPIQVKISVLLRWTEGKVGFNNMADSKNIAQRTCFWQPLMPSPFNLDKG